MHALTRQMRSNALSGQKSLKSVTSTYRPRQECHCGDSAKMAARSQGREELGALVPARMRLAERNNPGPASCLGAANGHKSPPEISAL